MSDFPIGEQGPELRTLPSGAHVYSAQHTHGLAAEYLDGDPIDQPHPVDTEQEKP